MDNISNVLKAFVITGGVVLIVGTIALVVMIVIRANQNDAPTAALPPAATGPATIALPTGAEIEQVSVDGRRLTLLGRDADGRQFILVVDADSGERLGHFQLQAR